MESELGAVADAERLLRGAAGRELCRLVALVPGFGPVRTPMMRRVGRPGPQPTRRQLLDEMATVIGTGNHQRFLRSADEAGPLAYVAEVVVGGGLVRSVVDDPAAEAQEADILLPVAAAIVAAPAAGWWPQPVAIDDQHLVHQDLGYGIAPPRPGHVHSDVRARMQQERSAEAQARGRRRHVPPGRKGRPVVGVAPDGAWWTTRSIPGLAAVGLICVPDPHAQLRGQYWSVHVEGQARIYEVGSVEAWRALLQRYARDVTYSRRDAWWRLTDWEGSWWLPDWSAVAADYDGVHLSVTGYLETVGLTIPVGPARTLVTGSGPDETFWLNDVIDLDGDPVEWEQEERS